MNVRHVIDAFTATPWAIRPEKLKQIAAVLELRAHGRKLSENEIAAAIGDRPSPPKAPVGVALLSIYGTLVPRADAMDESSGLLSYARIGGWLDQAMNDDSVSSVILDFDSPGGAVQGAPELAAKIRGYRGVKPMTAVANGDMASAAYWIASQADEVVASPSAILGSIGIIMAHLDQSKADEMEGFSYTILSAGKYKADGNTTHAPASEHWLEATQAVLNEFYGMITADIAKGRNVSAAEVRNGFGEGGIVTASQAVKLDMADRVATLDQVLAKATKRPTGRARADLELFQAPAAQLIDGTTPESMAAALTVNYGARSLLRALLTNPEIQATVIGAVTGDTAPATQVIPTPAPQAKESAMANDPAAPASNGADNQQINQRADDIMALAQTHKKDMAWAIAQAKSGKTVAQIGQEILGEYAQRLKDGPDISPRGHVGGPNTTGALPNAAHQPWGSAEYHELHARVASGAIPRTDRRYRAAVEMAMGEQLVAIAAARTPSGLFPGSGTNDPRLFAALGTGAASATVGADGAFAIQKEFTTDLLESAFSTGSLLSQTDSSEIGGNNDGLEVMYLDETSRATGSRWGGVQVYRGAEGDTATAKKPKFGKWETRLEDMIGLARISNRLLNDAASIGAVFGRGFQEEFTFMAEDELIRGTGAGQMVGILNAANTPTVSQAKETGQAAKTIAFENVANMWTQVHPRSQTRGNWYYNTEAFIQLIQMQIGTGASATLVYMPPGGISGSQYGSIFGRPCIPIEYAAGLGTVGDFFFADWSRYKVITKGGLQSDESMHVGFLVNEMTYRWVTRINGAPKDKSSITPYKTANSIKLSPFVTLATRA